MSKRDNFITFILILLMFIIFSLTIYFCLDVFGIIKVPEKYSIASLFYSQIEVIATGGEIITENIIPEDIIPDNIIENRNDKPETEEETEIVPNPLDEYNEKKNNQINNDYEENIFNENVNVTNFYYDQLDQYGKIIYDELYKNIDKLKTGTYTANFNTTFDELLHQENGKETLDNSFQLAINALTFDNPYLFYIDITKINLITEITTRPFSKTYKVSVGGNGESYLSDEFINQQDINNEIDKVEQIKTDIINDATRNETDVVEQIKKIHDYLVENVEYDSNAGRNIYNIYGSLINNRAVCEGYARAFKYILDEMGIPCIIVCGLGENHLGAIESHAWNYVQIDGIWYAIDVTWDDPVISNGNGRLTKEIKYKYFMVGSDKLFLDHVEDGNIVGDYNFTYPEISKDNY